MSALTQPFKFPVCFGYLFLTVGTNYKGDQPTAWREILQGEVAGGLLFGLLLLVAALAFGAFVATLLAIIRQLFSKSK